ncbi:MAG: hypothetical protein WC367_06675 [Methanoregula sp.]|jgi:hypothetical protein
MPGPEKNRLYTNGTVFALLLIALLAFTAPVTAATITINPGNSIQTVVNNATSGDTIILNPGTYFQSNISISTTITIRANTSYGGTAANTIIDGTKSGLSIFSVSSAGSVTFDSLTFTNGSANGNVGGAIKIDGGTISSITNSAFTGCSATYGGGAINNGGTIESITNTTFTGCSAPIGGAINNDIGGTISSITNSAFTGCSATNGGAIYNGGTISSITHSTFTDCSATNGGAIYNLYYSTIQSITHSTFTDCSATNGGAIYNDIGSTISSITSTTFTGCSAATNGGAIYNIGASDNNTIKSISFSRFYSNTAPNGPAIYNSGTPPSSINNWWGTNAGPGSSFSGPGTPNTWLLLGVTPGQMSITMAQTATIRANLTFNSTGYNTVSLGNVPDGIPVAYSVSGITGTFAPAQGNTTTGANTTVFTPTSLGAGTIAVTVDGGTVSVPVTVTAIPLTGTGAITGTPQVGSTLTAGAVAPSGATYDLQWNRSANSTGPFTPVPGATGSTYTLTSADLGMYLLVNATGTGSYTGSVNSTPVGPVAAAPTQTPTGSHGRQNTHSHSSGGSADVGYTGPQPTVMGYQPTQKATPQQPAGIPAVQQFSRPTLVAAVTPGTGTSAGFPVTIIALISGACVVVAGSAWYIRRWWIHRQNPALFKKYD